MDKLHTIHKCHCGDNHSFAEIEQQFDNPEYADVLPQYIEILRQWCYKYESPTGQYTSPIGNSKEIDAIFGLLILNPFDQQHKE